MTPRRDYELADTWIRAQAPAVRTEAARNLMVHALESLVPDASEHEDRLVAVSADNSMRLLILRGQRLCALGCTASPGAEPEFAITCDVLLIDPARTDLAVRQDWATSTAGGVASHNIRHRWSLRWAGRDRLEFVGTHGVGGFGRGPDGAQLLGVELARMLGWQIPGFGGT